jgi:hypothetical protein
MKSRLKADEMWLVTKLESNQKGPGGDQELVALEQADKTPHDSRLATDRCHGF